MQFEFPDCHESSFKEENKKIVFQNSSFVIFTRWLHFGHGYYVEVTDPKLMKTFNDKAKPIYNDRSKEWISDCANEDESDDSMEKKLARAKEVYKKDSSIKNTTGWNVIEKCIDFVCCHGGLTHCFWKEDLLCVGFDTCKRYNPISKEDFEKVKMYMEGENKVTDDFYIANCHALSNSLLKFINSKKRKRDKEIQDIEPSPKRCKK